MSSALRLRFDLAYDGTNFSGWARQPGLRTIEGELRAGLARILRMSEPPSLVVAGRTDAGVHALGQVVHADVPRAGWLAIPGRSDRPAEEAIVSRLAGVLPPDLVVGRVSVAPAGFDARFSAIYRRYRYRLLDRPNALDPLRRLDTVVLRGRLDQAVMDEAAQSLIGLNNFAAFCRRRPGATTIRTLLDYRWRRVGEVLEATVVADAFCHSMVRSLVGAIVPVGQGEQAVSWPREVLTAQRRVSEVVVMPPHGLSLMEVGYPPETELARRSLESRARRSLVQPGMLD